MASSLAADRARSGCRRPACEDVHGIPRVLRFVRSGGRALDIVRRNRSGSRISDFRRGGGGAGPRSAGARNRVEDRIASAGKTCDEVARAFLQGTRDGFQVWNAECADGHSYGILGDADGVKVVSCDAAEGITGTRCFEKF